MGLVKSLQLFFLLTVVLFFMVLLFAWVDKLERKNNEWESPLWQVAVAIGSTISLAVTFFFNSMYIEMLIPLFLLFVFTGIDIKRKRHREKLELFARLDREEEERIRFAKIEEQRLIEEKKKEEEEEKELLEQKSRSRKPIKQKVKDQVWNRDGGKCVQCGSNENLEFDHIIPHSKGGADTYRNIQLLCQSCNGRKSNKIG